MKKTFLKKIVMAVVVATTMTSLTPLGVSAATNNSMNNNFYNSVLNRIVNSGWTLDNGTWNYLDKAGDVKTGWIKDNGKWYYLDNTGAMQTGVVNINGKTYWKIELNNNKKEEKIIMTKQETITLNGKTYIEYKEGAEVKPAVETNHIIVIAQRGWIFEGLRDKKITDKIQLLNANVVRSWNNGKGIGGLCNKSNKSDYILDSVGTVSFPNEGVICTIDIVEW